MNTSIDNILQECANNDFNKVGIRNPYLVKESVRKDKTRFFNFHKIHDHNIDECLNLNDIIEELIVKGMLT